MKTIVLSIVAVLGLCACAGDPQMQSSDSVNGTSTSGMNTNLNDPRYYMHESEPALQQYQQMQQLRPASGNNWAPGSPGMR